MTTRLEQALGTMGKLRVQPVLDLIRSDRAREFAAGYCGPLTPGEQMVVNEALKGLVAYLEEPVGESREKPEPRVERTTTISSAWPEKCVICLMVRSEGLWNLAVTVRGGWEVCQYHADVFDRSGLRVLAEVSNRPEATSSTQVDGTLLAAENASLVLENDQLQREIEDLKVENTELKASRDEWRNSRAEGISRDLEAQKAIIDRQKEQIQQQRELLEEIEAVRDNFAREREQFRYQVRVLEGRIAEAKKALR